MGTGNFTRNVLAPPAAKAAVVAALSSETSTQTSGVATSGTVAPGSGPQTQAGINRSRANALQHGLTAITLVRESFPEGEIECFQQAFRTEWRPTTPTAEFLVEELARHAAALRRAQIMEGAVLRQGARAAITLSPAADLEECGTDLLQAGSVTSEGIERLTRYRRCHEKAFFAALVKLQEFRAFTPERPTDRPRPWPFETEEECRLYLRRRFEHPDHRCPVCGGAPGCWLTNRGRWQCASCRRQFGLRAGTVMAGSPLSLQTWFRAICLVLQQTAIAVRTLAAELGIRRHATARKLRTRIRAAVQSPDSSVLLAGLEAICGYRVRLHQAPLEAAYLQNDSAATQSTRAPEVQA
jgi:transposase-like protein